MSALGWTLAGFLAGWILGVAMSYRKIRRTRREGVRALLDVHAKIKGLRVVLKSDELALDAITDEQRKNLDKLSPAQITALFADKTKH